MAELEEVRGPSRYGLTVFAELNDPDYEGRNMFYVEYTGSLSALKPCASYAFASEQGALDAGEFELSNHQAEWLGCDPEIEEFLEKYNY
jgi:hypothetical protein